MAAHKTLYIIDDALFLAPKDEPPYISDGRLMGMLREATRPTSDHPFSGTEYAEAFATANPDLLSLAPSTIRFTEQGFFFRGLTDDSVRVVDITSKTSIPMVELTFKAPGKDELVRSSSYAAPRPLQQQLTEDANTIEKDGHGRLYVIPLDRHEVILVHGENLEAIVERLRSPSYDTLHRWLPQFKHRMDEHQIREKMKELPAPAP